MLMFAAGAVTSIGPCVGPRFIAVAGLASGKSRKNALMLVGAFVAGLALAYAAFGAVSSLLGRATQLSTCTYILVAVGLAAGGCVTLWREERCCHALGHTGAGAGPGGAFLLGASFALVLSPCCTPVVIGILTYTSAIGNAVYGSALLLCYALGHALPIVAVAFGMRGVTGVLERHTMRQAASVVSGTLMLALAAFYGILA